MGQPCVGIVEDLNQGLTTGHVTSRVAHGTVPDPEQIMHSQFWAVIGLDVLQRKPVGWISQVNQNQRIKDFTIQAVETIPTTIDIPLNAMPHILNMLFNILRPKPTLDPYFLGMLLISTGQPDNDLTASIWTSNDPKATPQINVGLS